MISCAVYPESAPLSMDSSPSFKTSLFILELLNIFLDKPFTYPGISSSEKVPHDENMPLPQHCSKCVIVWLNSTADNLHSQKALACI